MKFLFAILFFIASGSFCTSGNAQDVAKSKGPDPETPCLKQADVQSHHLHGLWLVRLYEGPLPDDTRQAVSRSPKQQGTLLFERHPEHAESLRGTFKIRGAQGTSWLSGDLEDGELILDESEDGQRISAVWVAYPTPNGCGKELRGNRRLADDDRLSTLVLTRATTWP